MDEVNGKLLYAGETDSEHNEFELYLDGERIARNVGYLWGDYYYYLTEKGDIYYASDLDVDDGVCNFKVNYYNGKESTTVIEDAPPSWQSMTVICSTSPIIAAAVIKEH